MKIYIDKFNLDILNNISELFKEYLVNTDIYITLYTSEGIYRIEDKHSYLLDVCDKNIRSYEKYYENFTLIVDASHFIKNKVNSVIGDTHLSFHTKELYYKLNKKSSIALVLKYNLGDNKHISEDIYFEIDKDIDINEPFIKKEIIEFLSVLN
jgi:hypothetical protein